MVKRSVAGESGPRSRQAFYLPLPLGNRLEEVWWPFLRRSRRKARPYLPKGLVSNQRVCASRLGAANATSISGVTDVYESVLVILTICAFNIEGYLGGASPTFYEKIAMCLPMNNKKIY